MTELKTFLLKNQFKTKYCILLKIIKKELSYLVILGMVFSQKRVFPLLKKAFKKVFKVADSQVASRWGNILDFNNFDLVTPNEKEIRFALADQDTSLRPLHQNFMKKQNVKL